MIEFSPLHDKKLPENVKGILLGGGYPELYGKELAENQSMLESMRRALDDKIPCLAECGGFMYLHEEMEDADGKTDRAKTAVVFDIEDVIKERYLKTVTEKNGRQVMDDNQLLKNQLLMALA